VDPSAVDRRLEPARQGRGFTEEDKIALATDMRAGIAQILPRWRALSDRVELSVSPYYHPIVPLLCNFASAREGDARPAAADAPISATRPWSRSAAPSTRARNISESGPGLLAVGGLGQRRGLRAVPLGGGGVGGHRRGDLRRSRREDGPRPSRLRFRDTAISNLLGFTYRQMDPGRRAKDFVTRLEGREGPVPVILDGENPWEHYSDGGVGFLRALFKALSEHPTIKTVTMSELTPRVDRPHLRRIVDQRNFGVWIGHPEDRKGWELLGRAYRDIQGSTNELAWECLRAAEGSDWYWWFGDDFTSAQDAEFDALFRRHLVNLYKAIARLRRRNLLRPIKQVRKMVVLREPSAFCR